MFWEEKYMNSDSYEGITFLKVKDIIINQIPSCEYKEKLAIIIDADFFDALLECDCDKRVAKLGEWVYRICSDEVEMVTMCEIIAAAFYTVYGQVQEDIGDFPTCYTADFIKLLLLANNNFEDYLAQVVLEIDIKEDCSCLYQSMAEGYVDEITKKLKDSLKEDFKLISDYSMVDSVLKDEYQLQKIISKKKELFHMYDIEAAEKCEMDI